MASESIESFRSEFTANLQARLAITRLQFDVQTLFDLDWWWIKEAILGLFFHLEIEEISISENKRNLQ